MALSFTYIKLYDAILYQILPFVTEGFAIAIFIASIAIGACCTVVLFVQKLLKRSVKFHKIFKMTLALLSCISLLIGIVLGIYTYMLHSGLDALYYAVLAFGAFAISGISFVILIVCIIINKIHKRRNQT